MKKKNADVLKAIYKSELNAFRCMNICQTAT